MEKRNISRGVDSKGDYWELIKVGKSKGKKYRKFSDAVNAKNKARI